MLPAKEALDRVVRDHDEARKHHDRFCDLVDRRYRAYRGILNRRSDAAMWTSQLHPPYILQIIETMVANLVDDNARSRVRPRPRMASPEEVDQHRAGAKTLELLLRYYEDLDHLQEKRRPFCLQGLITGLTVGKNYWVNSQGPRKRLETQNYPILDPQSGRQIADYPVLREREGVEVFRDDPTFEVVDVRDFLWHEAAPSLERSHFVIHRVWLSFHELKEMEKAGVYKNVDQLKESKDFSEDRGSREQSLFEQNRTKDMIEVLEYWCKEDNSVSTVANRKVLLSHKPFPFWHGEYPFVVCSSMPDLFRIPGVSEVEVVEQIQEALWTLMNQRIDNVQLLNNMIVLIRSDVDDPDSFEYAPGEKWMVDDPSQVVPLNVNPISAEISLQSEGMLRGDMQNIAGGLLSGADASTVDQKTATGVSIITSLAQKRLAAKKQNFTLADKRRGDQWIQLLQQFVREDRVIEVVGPDGDVAFLNVSPEQIQGRYTYEVEPATESMMRQERRAEAQAMLQVATQVAPVAAATGVPLNMKAFIEDFLDAFDRDNKERYFSAQPQMPPGAPGGAPNAQGQAPAGPGGVTAPQASDPSSPSNQTSLSPEVFMQRAQAMSGGGRNA